MEIFPRTLKLEENLKTIFSLVSTVLTNVFIAASYNLEAPSRGTSLGEAR